MLGIVLMVFVLVFREGLVPSVGLLVGRLRARPPPSATVSADLILETQGLEKRFGGVRAIAAVDFSLERGELRCLIGPNGAGKSTFFKLLTGQLEPSAAPSSSRASTSPAAAPHRIGRLGIGIKNQVQDVFDGLSVYENLYLAASSSRGRRIADARAGMLAAAPRPGAPARRPRSRRSPTASGSGSRSPWWWRASRS